ncbi:hypothetical protein [Agriterribacter sp.]|uniref:hypothetical protein n=1 Tax=Agriterribacter sp. TaxID=2821509 RepID=UPI002D030679|nr:hypothetical protein [Agriterribacter sp.]HTN07074.1 hypothetical protein [Agriterribacter sp.]
MKNQLYVLAFTLCFAGCKKDTVSRQDTSGPKLMFVKAKTNGADIIQNENRYNESGNIQTRISYKNYAAGLISAKTEYKYQDGRLVQKEDQMDVSSSSFASQYINSRSVFEYSGGRIIQNNHYLKTGNDYELRSFTVFSYDDAGHPVKQTRYSADGALFGYTTYTYNGNNIILSEEYNQKQPDPEPVLTLRCSYQHDNKKNPYRNVYHSIENIPFSVNGNNITATTTVNYNSYPPSTSGLSITSSTTYVYNNLSYPERMNESGNEFVLEYK